VECHVRSNVAVGRQAGSAGSPPSPLHAPTRRLGPREAGWATDTAAAGGWRCGRPGRGQPSRKRRSHMAGSSPGAQSHRLGGACPRPAAELACARALGGWPELHRAHRRPSLATLRALAASPSSWTSACQSTSALLAHATQLHAWPSSSWSGRAWKLAHAAFNPAAGYPAQFPSLCHRRTSPLRRHNPATPFTLHPNWLCQCVRLILVHLLHCSIAPRSTRAAHPPRSSSQPAGAPPRTALPWPALSGRVLFLLDFVSCSP
jgi:hypothetical protein